MTIESELEQAIKDLKEGKFVLVYDSEGREKETDLVIASEFIRPMSIRKMRKEAGGLICATVSYEAARALKLPLLVELYAEISNNNSNYEVLKRLSPYDIPYDTKSSFSLTINHRKTFTGISDYDRALTISELAKLIKNRSNEEKLLEEFGRNFRSPGHVPLLKAAKNLLKERQGHTELSIALMQFANLAPSATICEMIGENGKSLTKEEAKKYATKNDLVFLEGKDIIKVWSSRGRKWLK
ncbi:MAG: 3,4-dihydroxy-2-butanone-4-phosphate synthase [Candidatus Thermoplasmatota archaeon]|nr:3,4-dihydroxy-2-butanone-4-phosphate synthase [Candidatus Thermoplasmatota archaeon]